MWTHVVDTEGAPLFDLRPPAEPAAIRRVVLLRSCFSHPSMMLRVNAVMKPATIARRIARPRISICSCV